MYNGDKIKKLVHEGAFGIMDHCNKCGAEFHVKKAEGKIELLISRKYNCNNCIDLQYKAFTAFLMLQQVDLGES